MNARLGETRPGSKSYVDSQKGRKCKSNNEDEDANDVLGTQDLDIETKRGKPPNNPMDLVQKSIKRWRKKQAK